MHVSSGELNLLPFPPIPDSESLAKIDRLVSLLLDIKGVDCDEILIPRALELERQLDVEIGSVYGFSSDEVGEIEQSLTPYESVYGYSISSVGQMLYRQVSDHLEDSEWGKIIVLDIYSGDYEIGLDDAAATIRLLERRPQAVTYATRIGQSAAYHIGSIMSDR